LSSAATVPTASGSFNPADPTSYNFSTPETLYDSLGQAHSATFYFVNAAPNTWNVYTTVDGSSVNATQTNASQLSAALATAASAASAAGATSAQITSIQSAISTAAASPPVTSAALGAAASGAATSAGLTSAQALTIAGAVDMVPNSGSVASTLLQFNSAGSVTGTASGSLTVNLTNGAAPLTFSEDFSQMTQYGGNFGVNSLTQDGYTAGQLSNYSIGKDGTISGSYSNGQTQILGQVALANFTDPNGLTDMGNNQYGETLASGSALIGPPGTSSLGVLQSSAVEGSNVDLTAELVNLISAQRNYQANAQSIKAEDTVLQTIVSGL